MTGITYERTARASYRFTDPATGVSGHVKRTTSIHEGWAASAVRPRRTPVMTGFATRQEAVEAVVDHVTA